MWTSNDHIIHEYFTMYVNWLINQLIHHIKDIYAHDDDLQNGIIEYTPEYFHAGLVLRLYAYEIRGLELTRTKSQDEHNVITSVLEDAT